jgi:drug/metabolite transporter (DMT)-like permease
MALSSNLRGALFMSLSMAGFTFNDSIVKLLTDHINVGQVMFLRGVVATVLIYLLARQRRALRPIRLLADRWVGLRIWSARWVAPSPSSSACRISRLPMPRRSCRRCHWR